MSNKIALSLAATVLVGGMVACNSSSSSDTYSSQYSTAIVSSFSLSEDDNVVENLDSVFFSIDLDNASIFNADSLPYGTPVNKLVPVITVSSASVIELKVTRSNSSDTTYNYITNSTDTIDFSNPVDLRIVSLDGTTEMNYKIKVNVHTIPADTLAWTLLEQGNYPTRFSAIDNQRTTQAAGNYYCLSESAGAYCIAKASNPQNQWEYTTPQFGFTPNIDSFNGTDAALYILDTTGNLYTSTDGATWTSTGEQWNNIYGNYGETLLGNKVDGGKYYHASYPDNGNSSELPANFPVSGASQTINYTFEMSTTHQLAITGGRLADGNLSAITWIYDGANWAKITKRGLPYTFENMTVFPYFVTSFDYSTWTSSKESVLIAMYGNNSNGELNDTVYVSPDFGMHWEKADTLMQLPASMPRLTRAQAYVCKQTLTTRASSAWKSIYTLDIPTLAPKAAATSRATTAITEWECPYIYLFGGVDANGTTQKTMYRGVVNRLTFKPLQ